MLRMKLGMGFSGYSLLAFNRVQSLKQRMTILLLLMHFSPHSLYILNFGAASGSLQVEIGDQF